MLRLTLLLTLIGQPLMARDIHWDNGGSVYQRVAMVQEIMESGEGVRILGRCMSACTMFLNLPNVCVDTNALLMFHGPKRADGHPLTEQRYTDMVNLIADYYPQPISQWFLTKGHIGDNWVKGSELHKFGIKDC